MGLLCAQGQQRGDFCLAGLSFSCVHLIDFIFIAYLSIYFILGGDPNVRKVHECHVSLYKQLWARNNDALVMHCGSISRG